MNQVLNRLKVSTKIIIPIIFVLALGNVITNYVTTHQMQSLSKQNAQESLEMLTDSVFLTLRNAMNTGDPAVIAQAEKDSRETIKGLSNLTVAKSKETIELYSPQSAFTQDAQILKTFESKQQQVLEINDNQSDLIRVLRPMIATDECIACHANQKVGDVIGVIDLTFSLDSANEVISNTLLSIVTISFIFILATILVVWFVAKKATEPLKDLQHGLDIFFAFLAKERDTIEPFKVHSMDEVGEMVVAINKNIEKTLVGLQKDSDAIQESSKICEQASIGDFSIKINAVATNPEINNLTNIVNNLIASIQYNMSRVLKTLDEYSKDAYTTRIQSKGRTIGEMKRLFDQVDYLGETLTKLSTQNLKNGLALQQTSQVFSTNVQLLANASKEQAVSLNETSSALSDVTSNIQNTSVNANKMASLADIVKESSKTGETLAQNTAVSMDEINQKVNAINEAISIIDQIAFQTNILSLNAAVEAATAGEAGKGFAVVAGEVRNLASRSAEAAREIKHLVESASSQAKQGIEIANTMISGYGELNNNINETTQLIAIVSNDSMVQRAKIEQINSAIASIDKTTGENAKIAFDTNIVAQQASDIAQKIVEDAGGKKFDGKDTIQIRKKVIDPNYKGPERRKIEASLKK